MTKCNQCGMDLNGAKFCPNCGTSVNGEMALQYGVPMGSDSRQRSLAEMERMIKYFGAKKQWYDDFDIVSAEVSERSARSYGGWIGAAVISVVIGIFSEAFFFYIAAAAFIALSVLLNKKNKEKLNAATDRQNKIEKKLQAYYEEYGYCSVGMEYTKPATLKALYDLIRKGRASTSGDAINIYLADKQQEEMMRLQKEATDAAIKTERNTKKAAKSARKAARYSSASFWFK